MQDCEHMFAVIPAYVYLLGLYLGDGVLAYNGRSYQLRVTLDARYPGIIDSAASAIQAVVPHGRVHERARHGARVLESGWKHWPELLPQHGPGRKHTRAIELAAWQRALVDEHPHELLRGLIHSDGCRVVNRFMVELPSGRRAEYAYPRYFFSNLSADIRALFCEYCERAGIHWTQSNQRNISVSHRHSVAILDAFVGAKR
jgi:hypothetical protein